MNNFSDSKNIPDIILIRKFNPIKGKKRRLWKLKRMEIEGKDKKKNKDKGVAAETEFEEFLEDIDNDPEMRANLALYRVKI